MAMGTKMESLETLLGDEIHCTSHHWAKRNSKRCENFELFTMESVVSVAVASFPWLSDRNQNKRCGSASD